jgi:hypothetical protein
MTRCGDHGSTALGSTTADAVREEEDNIDLVRIMNEIENTVNPFTVPADSLYCLTTGKAVSESVKLDLIHSQTKGSHWHQEFVNDCKANAGRFKKPIKRWKVKNFTQDAVKVKKSQQKTNTLEK